MKREQIKTSLALAVSALCTHFDHTEDEFTCGHCGALALAVFKAFKQLYPEFSDHVELVVLYRIERDQQSNEEMDRCLSHVMFGLTGDLGDDELDIYGWDADSRWNQHIDENIEPGEPGWYNDVEYEQLKGDLAPTHLLTLCHEYGVSMDKTELLYRQLIEILTKNAPWQNVA